MTRRGEEEEEERDRLSLGRSHEKAGVVEDGAGSRGASEAQGVGKGKGTRVSERWMTRWSWKGSQGSRAKRLLCRGCVACPRQKGFGHRIFGSWPRPPGSVACCACTGAGSGLGWAALFVGAQRLWQTRYCGLRVAKLWLLGQWRGLAAPGACCRPASLHKPNGLRAVPETPQLRTI